MPPPWRDRPAGRIGRRGGTRTSTGAAGAAGSAPSVAGRPAGRRAHGSRPASAPEPTGYRAAADRPLRGRPVAAYPGGVSGQVSIPPPAVDLPFMLPSAVLAGP